MSAQTQPENYEEKLKRLASKVPLQVLINMNMFKQSYPFTLGDKPSDPNNLHGTALDLQNITGRAIEKESALIVSDTTENRDVLLALCASLQLYDAQNPAQLVIVDLPHELIGSFDSAMNVFRSAEVANLCANLNIEKQFDTVKQIETNAAYEPMYVPLEELTSDEKRKLFSEKFFVDVCGCTTIVADKNDAAHFLDKDKESDAHLLNNLVLNADNTFSYGYAYPNAIRAYRATVTNSVLVVVTDRVKFPYHTFNWQSHILLSVFVYDAAPIVDTTFFTKIAVLQKKPSELGMDAVRNLALFGWTQIYNEFVTWMHNHEHKDRFSLLCKKVKMTAKVEAKNLDDEQRQIRIVNDVLREQRFDYTDAFIEWMEKDVTKEIMHKTNLPAFLTSLNCFSIMFASAAKTEVVPTTSIYDNKDQEAKAEPGKDSILFDLQLKLNLAPKPTK